jgi:hypothetical protein
MGSMPHGKGCAASLLKPSDGPSRARPQATLYCRFGACAGRTLRLTPREAADFSPAISPNGSWLAVATGSGQARGPLLAVLPRRRG